MPWLEWQNTIASSTLLVGAMLTVALLAGGLGQWLRLPKVTSYLLAGVALGAILPDSIRHDQLDSIKPLTKLAIALVLFSLGCHFPLNQARRIMRRALKLSAGELGVTFLLMILGLVLLGATWSTALLLGALALATAPATTILMLQETESEGPVTEYTRALVAVNNLVSIVVFEVLFLAIVFFHGQLAHSPLRHLSQLVQDLIGSAALGMLAGLMVSYCFSLVAEVRRLVLLIGVIVVVLGICLATGMPYLLAFLAMGVTVANSSYQTRQVLSELDRLTGLLAVVFFVTHGAELEVDKLWQVGAMGVGYLVLRSGGKYLGIWLAARSAHEPPVVRTWLGATLVAQAGAAIALSDIAVQRCSEIGHGGLTSCCEQVQTIILGTVVVFEIVGPLLIRQAVLHAGEVPLAHAIHHPGISPLEQLRSVLNSLLVAIGRDPWHGRAKEELTVNEIMRKNVTAVPHSATFDELINRLEHSRDNTFPVVDSGNELVGVIRYRELSHALFDPALGTLVRVADLTVPAGRVLHPDDSITRASALFAASKDDCVPVITREEPQLLLGVVRRRDVLRLQIRDRTGNGGGH